MSGSPIELQQYAEAASDAFCQRYIKPSRRVLNRRTRCPSAENKASLQKHSVPSKFYRRRDHAASPFFKIVRNHFDEFERVYREKYQERYGYWRPVVRSSIDKFVKCGDLKEGFARVRCPECKEEFFVAFSCLQRSCYPSCYQKKALLLAHRLNEEVLADVPHRQWVFTIPKRLRVYFRYDRKLLGKLCRAAYKTVCEIFKQEIDGDCGVPAMIETAQTFGSVDNSVLIRRGDKAGMQRLVQYIARCPFSLTRMVSITKEGNILYRASHAQCIPFPLSGDETLIKGVPRNYKLYDLLDFLAEVTQHIPNKGEHQVRYYGFYSNRNCGHHLKKVLKTTSGTNAGEPDTPFRRKWRMMWAALIRSAFKVDPLKCPACGGSMKIVSFIEDGAVIEKILRHCNLWKEEPVRAPPHKMQVATTDTEPVYDYSFMEPA